jgi:hypothetical protein
LIRRKEEGSDTSLAHRKKKKAVNQIIHACRRANERYGLLVPQDRNRELVRMIQHHEGRCVGRNTCRLSVWELAVDGVLCRVLYDSHRKNVVTFMPQQTLGTPVERNQPQPLPRSMHEVLQDGGVDLTTCMRCGCEHAEGAPCPRCEERKRQSDG